MINLKFSKHAIERYIQRHDRSLNAYQAGQLLRREAAHAVNLHRRTLKNDADEWEIPTLGIVLLVKPDRFTGATEAARHVVVTILPKYAPAASDWNKIDDLHREAQAVFARVRAEKQDYVAAVQQAVDTLKNTPSKDTQAKTAQRGVIATLGQEQGKVQQRLDIARMELETIQALRGACKDARHLENLETTATILRDALRAALQAVTRSGYPEIVSAVFEAVERVNPDFLRDEFIHKSKQL